MFKGDGDMKKLLILVLLILALIMGFAYTFPDYLEIPFVDEKEIYNQEDEVEEDETEEDEKEKIEEATILAAGDVMVHSPQVDVARRLAREQAREYNFLPSFEYISPYLNKADISVANLETTLGPGAPSGYPYFNSPDELAVDLKKAGFDLLCTANNHSLDTGEEGLYRTLDVVEEEGLKPFGTARSQEERDTPLIVDVNNIEVAFLAYTDSTNAIPIPEGREYMVNYIDVNSEEGLSRGKEMISSDIEAAREEGAEIVAVYMHWGDEYQIPGPNNLQERLAKKVAHSGGDIIFGSHPHVIQPMEFLEVEKEDGSTHETLVVYSMGNFISNQHKIPGAVPAEEVKYGLSVKVHLKKEGKESPAEVDEVDYLITWVNRDYKYQVIPVHYLLDGSPEEFNIPEEKFQRIEPVTGETTRRLGDFQPVSALEEVLSN